MLKDELEAAIKSDNVWAGRSTLVLAIGILGEYVLLPFLDDKKSQHKLAKVLFAILVVAGIFGEYKFSSRIADNAAQLQRLADDELSVASRKAADASIKAADAITESGKATERATANEKEAARLNKLAQHEMLERVKLEKLLQGRSLSKEQESRLAKRLKPLTGLVVDVIVLDQEDQSSRDEASALGSSLANVLRKAGLDIAGFVPMGDCPTMSLVGVAVTSPNDPTDQREKAGDLFKAISAELKTLPYVASLTLPDCHFSSLPNVTNSRLMIANIRVLIGRKPVPILTSEEPSLKQ